MKREGDKQFFEKIFGEGYIVEILHYKGVSMCCLLL